MANETTTAGINHIERVYSDSISAAFLKSVVAMQLIHSEDLPDGTLVKSYKNKVGMTETSGTVAEAGNFTTVTQHTNTQGNLTAAKTPTSSTLTVEALDFNLTSDQEVVDEQTSALKRGTDTEILALFPSFTNSITAVGAGVVDDLYDSCFLTADATQRDVVFRGIFGRKFINTIRKEIQNSGGASYTIENRLSVLGQPGQPLAQVNGYVGSIPGLDLFQTSGFSTSSSNVVQAIFDPTDAIEGIYGKGVNTWAIKVGRGNPSFVIELSSYFYHACLMRRSGAGTKYASPQ